MISRCTVVKKHFQLLILEFGPTAQYGKQPNSQSLTTMTSTSSSMTSSLPESDSELLCGTLNPNFVFPQIITEKNFPIECETIYETDVVSE